VYNWTDAPVIVSRDRLLFLDPHREWSDGGPVYDFVTNSSDASIKNHMAAFQSVMEHTTQRLEGTVIRIPLRTEEHARKSEISESAITVSQIDQVLQLFASEFGRNGLLFMRNVERLEIGSRTGSSIQIELVGGDTIRL
jgi:sacsin